MTRYKGKIKVIKDNRYGFIKVADRDIYFQLRNVQASDLPLIKEGAEVEFDIAPGAKDQQAVKVSVIEAQTIQAGRPMPKDTYDVLRNNINLIDNFSLRLNRAGYYDNGFIIYRKEERNHNKCAVDVSFDGKKIPIKEIVFRYNNSLDSLGIVLERFIISTRGNLVVGLGSSSVYETSMTLHHIYGFPFIPSSALKGVTRSWVVNKYFDGEEGNKKVGAYADKGFCQIFGCPANSVLSAFKGSVLFFDAFPIESPKVTKDILTPHFSEYYSQKKERNSGESQAPVDSLNPKPVFFLTVKNTRFSITVGTRSDKNLIINEGVFQGYTVLDVVLREIKDALTQAGLGAKTAVGYGLMDI